MAESMNDDEINKLFNGICSLLNIWIHLIILSNLKDTFQAFNKIYSKNENSVESIQTDSISKLVATTSNSEQSNQKLKKKEIDEDLESNIAKLAKNCNENSMSLFFHSILEINQAINTFKISNDIDDDDGDELKAMVASTLETISKKMSQNSNNEKLSVKEIDKILKDISAFDMKSDQNYPSSCDANLMPMMETMMKNILSKDLLYPTLSDLKSKYPTYLAENKLNLSDEDYERYQKQSKIINQICEAYEKEENDDEPTNLDTIVNLMQSMQTLGLPPEELAPQNTELFDKMFDTFPGTLCSIS
ncbi:Peroxisomal biogenesis factor 19 [Sarcoptes scabiei]|uniref:Peroxin-19 n=1 Tax=Sarcoptes scabiei TaxID=52283 RepID=A0A834VC31_SARSC|nr:Peroxisomal biogenesis factor 19 [Sarcoptes scabiei]